MTDRAHPIPPASDRPQNVSELTIIPSDGYTVSEWTPERDGKGKPEMVCLRLHLAERLDGAEVVMRVKSRAELNRLILVLARHRDSVWPVKDDKGCACGDGAVSYSVLGMEYREGAVEVVPVHVLSETNLPDALVFRAVRENGTEVHVPLCPHLAAGLGQALFEWGDRPQAGPEDTSEPIRSHFWPWLCDTLIYDTRVLKVHDGPSPGRPFAHDPRHRWKNKGVTVIASFERVPDGRDLLHVSVGGAGSMKNCLPYAAQVAPCRWQYAFTTALGVSHFCAPMKDALKAVGLEYSGPGLKEDL